MIIAKQLLSAIAERTNSGTGEGDETRQKQP